MSSFNQLPESAQVAIASRLKKQSNLSSLAQTSKSAQVAASAARDLRARRVAKATSALRANARIAKILQDRSLSKRIAAAIVQSIQATHASASQLRRAGFEIRTLPGELMGAKSRTFHLHSDTSITIVTHVWQAVPRGDDEDVTADVEVKLNNKDGEFILLGFGRTISDKVVKLEKRDTNPELVTFIAVIQALLRRDGIVLVYNHGSKLYEFGSPTTPLSFNWLWKMATTK